MSLRIEHSLPSDYSNAFNTNNKFVDSIISVFDNSPGYYEEIKPEDGLIDKIQKKWRNNSAYMPENGKKGLDLINAKVHNFIAALSYYEDPIALWKFRNLSNLDHCRLC